MGIADFFRPKYRHSDVKVRLEAVRALTSEDSDILANIAKTDRETTVRRVAIEKLDEASVLAAIAKEESDRTLRDLAGSRAASLWVSRACQDGDGAEAALDGLFDLGDQRALAEVAARAARPQVRATALGRIDDQRALAELAKQTSHQGLRTQALERITDPDVLGAIALDTTNKELGIAAVDRFEEEDVLEKVAQKAKHKAIRARARRKLEELADDRRASTPKVSDAVRRRQAEQAQLLRELSALHETHEWEKSLAVVTRIEAEWARLAGADDAAVEERFQKEVARYHERRKAAIDLVEAHRHEIEEKRRSAEHKVVAPAPEAVSPARLAAAAVPRDERETVRIKPDLVVAGSQAAEQRAAEKKEQEERAKAIAASLDALLGEMQTMLESTDGRAIDRLLGQAAKAFEQVTRVAGEQRRALEDRYQQTRSALVIKVQELREAEDWKQWANVPRAEALIREATAMLESEEPPQLDKLKDLQGRWKSVGAIPRKKSQELWEKFKATCDQVFEKVKAGRAVAAEQAAAAAAVKEELITQAEALAESTDWDATAEAFKELQRRWKESGNVPRKQGDALWKRFRSACDRFFERRKPHLEAHLAEQTENLEAKTALCERAEAVVAGAPPEAGWGAAINEIKELQRRWKDIGYVPRKDADAIYRRFRDACDGLFAKRDAARDAESDARRAELDAVRASLAEAADPAKLIALRATLKELASRDVRPDSVLAAEIERVTLEALNANPAGFAGTELDVEAMRARREKLVARADELLPKERPTIEANLSPDEIVARLKSAMASNALGDFRGAGRDPFEAVHELRTAWNEIGPVVGEASEALATRFAEICKQVIAGAEAEGRRDQREQREDRPPREDRPRRDDRPRRERRERRPREEAAPAPAAGAAAAPAAASASEEAQPAPSTDPDPAPAPEPAPVPAPAPEAPAAETDVDSGWD